MATTKLLYDDSVPYIVTTLLPIYREHFIPIVDDETEQLIAYVRRDLVRSKWGWGNKIYTIDDIAPEFGDKPFEMLWDRETERYNGEREFAAQRQYQGGSSVSREAKPRVTISLGNFIAAGIVLLVSIYALCFVWPPVKYAVRKVTPWSLPWLCNQPTPNAIEDANALLSDSVVTFKEFPEIGSHLLDGNCIAGFEIHAMKLAGISPSAGLLVPTSQIDNVTYKKGAGNKNCLPLQNDLNTYSICLNVREYNGEGIILLEVDYWLAKYEPVVFQQIHPSATSAASP